MKGSGTCNERVNLYVSNSSKTSLTFKASKRTYENKGTIAYYQEKIFPAQWIFYLQKHTLTDLYKNDFEKTQLLEKVFDELLESPANHSIKNYPSKKKAREHIKKTFEKYGLDSPIGKESIYNHYACKECPTFVIYKDMNIQNNNWQIDINDHTKNFDKLYPLYIDAGLKGLKFKTRSEAAASLEYFLKAHEII